MNILHTHLLDAATAVPVPPPALPRRAARAALAGLAAWRRAGIERRQLARLDGRALRDLALSRADVMREVEAPVWPAVLAAARAAWRRT